MSLNIIGITSHFHDSACCLLQNGKLVAAAEEERFTRIKHDSAIPKRAFQYCLATAGLTPADIDCVAYYELPKKKLERQLWAGLPDAPPMQKNALFKLDASRPEREIREVLGFNGPIEWFSHHASHSASAYYFSGFPDAALLTVDSVGEWASTTYGTAKGASLEIFKETHFPHSLGLLYSTLTGYLGFEVNEGEYKVMGLAPYGKPRYLEQLRDLVEINDTGDVALKLDYFDFNRSDRMHTEKLCTLLGQPARKPESELDQFTQDVARSLQVLLEESLLKMTRYLYERSPSENLCMAGGVALNCVANGKILRDGPFKRLFVQPAAGDDGCALGAAALCHVKLSGADLPRERLGHVYLGPKYSAEEVAACTDLLPKKKAYGKNEAALLRDTARRLADGKIIGWFHGRMEFGPRSLGARSILADPRQPEMRDKINAMVKKREGFRPFAPAVLASEASKHFDLNHASPFMLETCQVISHLDLPAITHVDGSARVQTVHDESSPRFAALLKAFQKITGCPILLNTSFNVRGEPIVCTPEDALLCFISSDIDTLVLEDHIIDRSDLPEHWITWFRNRQPVRADGPGNSVYTLF
jgi:carbamoyltransferase